MNKVILMGRPARDPDIRYTQGEKPTAVARFTLAVDRRFKREGEQTADFISCVAFGKTAEFIEKYIQQGVRILCEGRIQTGSYDKNGQKVYTTDVVVENVEFADSKGAAAQNATAPQQQPPVQSAPSAEGFVHVDADDEDGLPFN